MADPRLVTPACTLRSGALIASLDLNAAVLSLMGFGEMDFEHAILKTRVHSFRIDRYRQADIPREGTPHNFGSMHLTLFVLLL